MLYKTKTTKNINFITQTALLLFVLLFSIQTQAQKNKIDGVEVVVGEHIVLDSDIAKFKEDVERQSEGKIKLTDCEMLEELMMQKLLAHHAVIDSISVTDDQINSNVERNIAYFTQQYGSVDKMVKVYGFNDVDDLKKELFKIEKENSLVRKEQESITSKVDVTPEEVRIFYNGLKAKNELPNFPAEIELEQLVVYAKPDKKEIERVINKLKQIKEDVENGGSFKLKAILNSDDPSVTQNNGQMLVDKDKNLVKEFKEVAFSLDKEGQISEPFKTMFGYHIIQLNKIQGRQRLVSHILITPVIPDSKLKEIEEKVAKIREEITSKKITFEEAVKKYSEDEDTKNNDGLLINGQTNDTKFDLTRMDPTLYARVSNLKKGEITPTYYDETEGGGLKMYKLIYMKTRTEAHIADLVKDYVKVQQLALEKKKDETVTKWAKKKINDTYIKISDKYRKCTFKKNWKKEIE